MSEICYKPVRSSVNYHVMFLQNPIPQAILATDGQFIDANSQFCRFVVHVQYDLVLLKKLSNNYVK